MNKNKENKILKTIILDSFLLGDLCTLCKNKGQNLPECTCKTNMECLDHMIKLYEVKNERI